MTAAMPRGSSGGQHPDGRDGRTDKRGGGAAGTGGERADDEHDFDAFQEHAFEGHEPPGPVGVPGRRQRCVVERLLRLDVLGQR
jgi:hypothetical protein